MNALRKAWNRFLIFAFDLFLYDALSMVGCVLLLCAIGFTLGKAKNLSATALCALWLAAALALGFSRGKKYLRKTICKNGIKIKGEVTGIRRLGAKVHMRMTHYADEDAVCPFVIEYRYNFKGQEYAGKSEYFWHRPYLERGSAVMIFVDEKHPSRSACNESSFL